MCTSESTTASDALTWVPTSCTLPTAEQPIRVAEFDDLFAASVRTADRLGPTALQLSLDAAAEDRARALAAQESSCCSFFGFDFTPAEPGSLSMIVTVPTAYVAVLDAFAARTAALAGLNRTAGTREH